MKSKLFFLVLMLLFFFSNVFSSGLKNNDKQNLRNLFLLAVSDENYNDSLLSYITTLEENNVEEKNQPLLLVYKGVGKALMAKYAFFPWNKFMYVSDGLELLNEAFHKDSTSFEIRFLRFSILSELPWFIGYSDYADIEVNNIFNYLINLNDNYDDTIIVQAINYLSKCERLDDERKNNLMNKFKFKQNADLSFN